MNGMEVWTDGLSPRVRGNWASCTRVVVLAVFIPARAGELGVLFISPLPGGFYPRACGGIGVLRVN